MGRTEREQTNMRKAQKKQIQELLGLLEQAHEEIKGLVENNKCDKARELLGQCQESAVQVGELIEQEEGENAPTIEKMENYCEVLYEIYEELGSDMVAATSKLSKKLRKSLIRVENSVKNDIKTRLEMVFLPYKVSMWDSLESVWRAADADPDCDAYVVPIPYYDKNQDGSLGAFHYEGDLLPSDVPVTHYDEYRIENREPDAIFIHNPYDDYNRVTSVEPRFYSRELKKYTECLVYVPYFITSGSMNAGQTSCMAYYFADYIIIQAEKFRKFYDPDLPREKLVPLGSPKIDKVMRLCENPPEPPEAWKEKMTGRKVFFYNTSINGMLQDTEAFLRKMEYVFKCFARCGNACLLWRPHPLLESTFDSMRAEYKPVYEKLKQYFTNNNLGIYDDTPEIEPTIALCDAYIGDAGTSVTALFGAAGKPIFILNNRIDREPEEDDWRGEVIQGFCDNANDEYMVTGGNKLYRAYEGNYEYRYCCDLCEYAYGSYYFSWVISVLGKEYVCPSSAQEILCVEEGRIEKRVKLNRYLEQGNAFSSAVGCGKYLLLLPNQYPAVVIYNTETGEIRYLTEYLEIYADESRGERRFGGFCAWKDYVFLTSPVDNHVVSIHVPTGKMQLMVTGAEKACGCSLAVADQDGIWLLPYEGYVVTRWNPENGEVREYDCYIEGLQCNNPVYGYECNMIPFSYPAFVENMLYLPPFWGNRYLRLNKNTGEITEWEPSCRKQRKKTNCYYLPAGETAVFYRNSGREEGWQIFTYADKKLYDVDFITGECQERTISFPVEERQKLAVGFERISEWGMYAACEGYFNTLPDFLKGTLKGRPFSAGRARQEFESIAVNSDGTCGEKLYAFIKDKLLL